MILEIDFIVGLILGFISGVMLYWFQNESYQKRQGYDHDPFDDNLKQDLSFTFMIKTVSLDTAKKLKEAGFPQESHFYYRYHAAFSGYEIENQDSFVRSIMDGSFLWYAAPLADEILELLPWKLDFGDGLLKFLVISKVQGGYQVGYQNNEKHDYVDGYIGNEYLAIATAQMWMHLKHSNLL